MRYDETDVFYLPRDARYNKLLKKRNVEGVYLRTTPELVSAVDLDHSIITEASELWGIGTKLWKLAAKHYGDGNLYWVIGLYNIKPTDAHWSIGDRVYIPFPYEYVAEELRGT